MKSRYATIRAYKRNQSSSKDYEILTNMKYPDYLVAFAYNNLKNANIDIGPRLLEIEGIRNKYIIKLLFHKKNKFLFTTHEYLHECIEFYQLNSKEFLCQNIVKYTQKFLTETNLQKFTKLWKLVPKNQIYQLDGDLDKCQRSLVEAIAEPKGEYLRFYISNNIFNNFTKEDPLFQISQVVKILSSTDINEKIEILTTGIHIAFKKIIETDFIIYNILHPLSFNESKIEINGVELTQELIFDLYSKITRSNYDNLHVRKIINFFCDRVITKNWHKYFTYNSNIESYDDFFINVNIFQVRNYNCIFDKNDLLMMESFIQMDGNSFDLLLVSLKNPGFKGQLKKTLEKQLISGTFDPINLASHDLIYLTGMSIFNMFCTPLNLATNNAVNPINEPNIKNGEALTCVDPSQIFNALKFSNSQPPVFIINHFLSKLLEDKEILIYTILYEIGCKNFIDLFDKYSEKYFMIFIGVFLEFLKDKTLYFEPYKKYFSGLLTDRLHSSNDLKYNVTTALLFEISTFTGNFNADFYLNKIHLYNPAIIDHFDIRNILEHFGSLKETILQVIKAYELSSDIFNSKIITNIVLKIFNKHKYDESLFTEDFSHFITKIINFAIKEDCILARTQNNLTINMNDVILNDSFISSLLFENKTIHSLINTFYLSNDIEIKFYMPKFWNIYFKRNKVEDLDTFFGNAKSQINNMHKLAIMTALFNQNNKGIILKHFKVISAQSQDILFFKFLFLFYNLRFNDSEVFNIFNEMKGLAKSSDCVFIVGLILWYYKIGSNQSCKMSLPGTDLCAGTANEQFKIENFASLASDMQKGKLNKKFPNISKIFTPEKVACEKYTVFEAARFLEEKSTFDYRDKTGTMDYLYLKLMDNPIFYLKIFTELDFIQTFDWSILEFLISQDKCLKEITQLLYKHKNITRFNTLIELLKKKDEFYTSELINSLPKDEIINIVNDKDFCNLSVFKALKSIDLFPILKNGLFYKHDHYKILNEYIRLGDLEKYTDTEYNINNKDCHSLYYCLLYEAILKKCVSKLLSFVITLKHLPNVPFDYTFFRQESLIHDIVTCYLKSQSKNVLRLIKYIMGDDEYFYMLIIEEYTFLKHVVKDIIKLSLDESK